MASQQRLIVCLDGTWNQQDSSTSVLHHFNLVREGDIPGTNINQRRYYHAGVGTGVLDGVTGGGLGFGMEKNVRDAYNWLVENYCDGAGNDRPADEIYIFGFSRGAYTARSLVGFIGQCGLLRRAAPITVNQLWKDYCIIGRNKEQRKSVWDGIFSKPKAGIRPITELVHDPWPPDKAGIRYKSDAELKDSEPLLVRWSRRVKITYLGIYDTVGAVGWDALAIPGLTSRLALHNNLNPTTIIQHCRHALAIDEHRSSFNHTPFLAFVGNDASVQEERRGTEDSARPPSEPTETASQHWDKIRAMWSRKIEQRWFAGAHSNIGGGYEDNRLAETPLQWILDGAATVGLVGESAGFDPPVTAAKLLPRDSFAEFVPPLWTKIIRAKPNYRLIDPDAVSRASVKKADASGPPAGFSLQTINETLDPSVFTYWSGRPMPPNLYEYANRRSPPIDAKPPEHSWLPEKVRDYVALVLWAMLAAAGLATLYKLTESHPSQLTILVCACIAAFVFPLVDWGESLVNFRRAMGKGGPRARAFLDAIYWARALGFVLFLFGVVYCAGHLWKLGWWKDWDGMATFAWICGAALASAAVAAILATRFRSKAAWISLLPGAAAIFVAGALLMVLARLAHHFFGGGSVPAEATGNPLPPVAGWLLLLQLAFLYLWKASSWNAEPMSKANLGSIIGLQVCFTPNSVWKRLERWRYMLECRWADADRVKVSANRMRDVLRESLWRDILGYIPVYSGVILLGLWFASTHCKWWIFDFLRQSVGPVAVWWLIPLVAAAADYAEDICHLRYLKLHENDKKPSFLLPLFSCLMSGIKGIAVIGALLIASAAILDATLQIWSQPAGWRGIIAILTSITFASAAISYAAGRLVHIFVQYGKVGPDPGHPALAKSAAGGG